jgi:hypothetical protein
MVNIDHIVNNVSKKVKYYICSNGDVFSNNRKLSVRMGGYKKRYCRFQVNKKDFYTHRVVLEALVRKPRGNEQACHNDGNPTNNSIDNLRWDTPKNNCIDKIKHGTSGAGQKNSMSKIDDLSALAIATGYGFFKSKELSEMFNLAQSSISGICTGSIRNNPELEQTYRYNKKVAKERMRTAYANKV